MFPRQDSIFFPRFSFDGSAQQSYAGQPGQPGAQQQHAAGYHGSGAGQGVNQQAVNAASGGNGSGGASGAVPSNSTSNGAGGAQSGSNGAGNYGQPPQEFGYVDMQRDYSFVYPGGAAAANNPAAAAAAASQYGPFIQPYSSERMLHAGSDHLFGGRRPSEQLDAFGQPPPMLQNQAVNQAVNQQPQGGNQQGSMSGAAAAAAAAAAAQQYQQYQQAQQAGLISRQGSRFFKRIPSMQQPGAAGQDVQQGDIDSFLKRDGVGDILDTLPGYQEAAQQQQQQQQQQQTSQQGSGSGNGNGGSGNGSASSRSPQGTHGRRSSIYQTPMLPLPSRMVNQPMGFQAQQRHGPQGAQGAQQGQYQAQFQAQMQPPSLQPQFAQQLQQMQRAQAAQGRTQLQLQAQRSGLSLGSTAQEQAKAVIRKAKERRTRRPRKRKKSDADNADDSDSKRKKSLPVPNAQLVPQVKDLRTGAANGGKSVLVPASEAMHTEDGRPLIGATKVDQLMLVIQARKKGLTGDIKQAEDGTILEEITGPDGTKSQPSVLPNPVELVGGVEKPNIRGNKQHQCQYCLKKFTQSTHLEVHIRSHIGLRPYQCSYCGKRFTQGGNLRTHLRLHTGEKPFRCETCGKMFSRKGNLQAHQLTHQNVRPFQCKFDNCNKSFTQLGNLKAHQNRFHQDTINALTNRLAHMNSPEDFDRLPEQERQLLSYFADLYKNLNRGIRGRGRSMKKKERRK
ncbi:DEKNAAC101111 [Brettanomyces naardenensis]|uniref:DEKNAAC101111 n=1 Tax=Brettanomyces naardenensis TaxID=13370 RepID=A0A448YHB0_BRENA|nr:DEKNAAC101111 [Brettanomyces naardenensis]